MVNSSVSEKFAEGVTIRSTDSDFEEGLRAAVDYRGDVTLQLKDGSLVEGFLFNSFQGMLDVFPKNSPQKRSVAIDTLESIVFSGKDEAKGKSWEEWVKKREAESPQHQAHS